MTALQNVDQLIGRRIGGRYQIDSRLGVGAVATIYRARGGNPPRDVALKVIRPEIGRNPTVSARFQREVKAASKLDHPGIVRVLDWGLEGDMPWLAMELIEGEDLFEVLDRAGPLPQAWSVAVAMRVCEALEAAHQQGVVHRDLKPENIMLTTPDARTGEQQVKVLDFGIAKLLGPGPGDVFSDETVPQVLTKAGSAVGTPSHMAPEQARGDEVDGRADIYAVGVLLYEMITGHLPFEGTNPMLVAIQQVKDPPPPPSTHLPFINPSLERLILKMLEKLPADRPQSANDLAQELVAVLARVDDEDDPTVRHPSSHSAVSAMPGGLHQSATRVTGLDQQVDDDEEDDEDEEHIATRLMYDDEGPSTFLLEDDGPSTRLVEDDDEGPSTFLLEDDGPSTRLVEDDDDEDDEGATLMVEERAAASDDEAGDPWEGTTKRVFIPSEVRARATEELDSDDVTLRQEAADTFEILDELTSPDRRPKPPRPRGELDGLGRRRMSPELRDEPEPREVSTRIVDPPPDEAPSPRMVMDSEAPIETAVVDPDPVVAAARDATGFERRHAGPLGTARVPQFDPSPQRDDDRPLEAPDEPFERERRRAAYHVEDRDSEAPVATVVADQSELVQSARRAASVAVEITGTGQRPRHKTPRPPVGNEVLEAPPPPPPASEPRGAASTEGGATSSGPYDAVRLPTSATPHFPPRPEETGLAGSNPADGGTSAPSPVGERSGTAPLVDWSGPVSRNYAGELEDMLRQMPKQKGRPVFTIVLIVLLVLAALAALFWVIFY